MTELCNKLPNDILLHIKKFVYCRCYVCNHENVAEDVSFDIYLKKYTAVFEDDFYIITPDAIYFKILCIKCHFNFLKQNYYPIGREKYNKTKKLIS